MLFHQSEQKYSQLNAIFSIPGHLNHIFLSIYVGYEAATFVCISAVKINPLVSKEILVVNFQTTIWHNGHNMIRTFRNFKFRKTLMPEIR
jgi:hypothetical protein